ncbi:MAG: uroporphyrinogen decarboxylase family protein [Deferrisomatales bacterium]|nr:uroporphyrinogen decarboxylase family protein [Deferrisomatales bacterium]
MTLSDLLQERIDIIDDAVRMKKPKRVPFITVDAFWRYYDTGHKLSEALLNTKIMHDATIEFQKRYQHDGWLDIGARNPLQVTRSLGNYEYNIDDQNNVLMLKEQCCFKETDYDPFVENPIRTLWENVITRKYTLFNQDMPSEVLCNTFGKFFELDAAIKTIIQRLATECGVPPLTSVQSGPGIFTAFECLYNFLRGMKGLAVDLRRCPEKILAFGQVYHELFVKGAINSIENTAVATSSFTALTSLLNQNLVSAKQFGKFCWPHFKELTDRIVDTNNKLLILSEGTTVHITEYLQELPKGHFCVYVEMDDIFEARKRLPNLCLWGGLPLSLLARGTQQECIDHTKRVIDEVGRDGGLILCTDKFSSAPGDCKRSNLLAVAEFIQTYR